MAQAESFFHITEIAGDDVTQEQVDRVVHRYRWASEICRGRDAVEAGCGTGPGLTLLASTSKSFEAGDYSGQMVDICRRRLGDRVTIRQFDAQQLPFETASKDVVILFEALYYVPDAHKFFAECARVLRPGGDLLIATANKDLPDFNPSPQSHAYLGTVELARASVQHGFDCRVFGYLPADATSLRQRLLRPAKKIAVALNLMPKTNDSKKWLKRIVFGSLVKMPADITPGAFTPPAPLSGTDPDRRHKVIYCRATRRSG